MTPDSPLPAGIVEVNIDDLRARMAHLRAENEKKGMSRAQNAPITAKKQHIASVPGVIPAGDGVIDELKGLDLLPLYRRWFRPVAERPGGGDEVSLSCFRREGHAHGDRNPSLSLNTRSQTWVCYACDMGGSIVELIAYRQGWSDGGRPPEDRLDEVAKVGGEELLGHTFEQRNGTWVKKVSYTPLAVAVDVPIAPVGIAPVAGVGATPVAALPTPVALPPGPSEAVRVAPGPGEGDGGAVLHAVSDPDAELTFGSLGVIGPVGGEVAEGSAPAEVALLPQDELIWARAFAATVADELRYDAIAKQWFSWDGARWRGEDAGDAQARARYQGYVTTEAHAYTLKEDKASGEMVKKPTPSWATTFGRMKAVLSHAETIAPLMVNQQGYWDSRATLLNTVGSVVELHAGGSIRPSTPEDAMTKVMGCAYEPGAACPQFDKALAEILPDSEVRGYLQRLIGMALLGEVREAVLPVFIGDGANGKSVLIKIFTALFGDYAATVKKELFVKTRNETHDTKMMPLKGARLAVTEETSDGSAWDSERINELTGGGKVVGRPMHGNFQEWEPSHTFLVATNHRPKVQAGETAFWRRYREIRFEQSFLGREDVGLAQRIVEQELPGVLLWALAGYKAYLSQGLAEPSSILLSSMAARSGSNMFETFLEECLTEDPHGQLYVGEIFTLWKNYKARESSLGNERPNQAKDVSDVVIKLLPYATRGKRGKHGYPIHGIGLTEYGQTFRGTPMIRPFGQQ